MNVLSGEHPGSRAAPARGGVATGSFPATAEAAAICRAPHLQGDTVETTVRLSNGSGDPEAPDADRREGRGLAVKFHLDGGDATDIVSVSIPVFMVRAPEDFLEFLHARVPDPDTGELDMERIGAFLQQHPETAAALQLILPALTPPRSYATVAYNSLHAFRFLNAEGEARHGRYRWIPEAGEETLADEEIETAERDYLQREIGERLGSGAVRFTLQLKLSGEGDPLDDPTVLWPDDRETVTLGRLEVCELI